MDIELLASFLTIGILIILSAIFSGTEAAFLGASRAKLHHLSKKEGIKRAKLVTFLKGKMENVVGTILICNNLVNIFASSLATGLLINFFQEAGIFYATTSMTILIILFGEVIPKFYGMRYAEKFSMGMASTLKVLIFICRPVTYIFEIAARGIFRLLGIQVNPGEVLGGATEELRGIIDLHRGDADKMQERAMLQSILDLGDVDVSEVMVHRSDVKMINLDDPPRKIISEIVASYHTRLPLWQENPENIIGIIHTKSFLRLIETTDKGGSSMTKADILAIAKKPWFIPNTTTLFEQLQAFRKRREHMALVVDEYGALQGLVTLEDIIEEIVGDIDDEYDPNQMGFWQTKKGEVFVVGTTTLRDLNRYYDWSLPDEEAATVAGLLMHESRNIPTINQVFKIEGFKFQVLKKLRNQITLVKIIPPQEKVVPDAVSSTNSR